MPVFEKLLNSMTLKLAATYEISHILSLLFSRDVQVNWYLTRLWTTVVQHPHKL